MSWWPEPDAEVSLFLGLLLLAVGFTGSPTPSWVFGLAAMLLWWTAVRALPKPLRRWWKQRTERRHIAALLHASNAWHCGCGPCVAERVALHGDVSRRVIPGPWPVVVEKWKPTEAEWLSTWRNLK